MVSSIFGAFLASLSSRGEIDRSRFIPAVRAFCLARRSCSMARLSSPAKPVVLADGTDASSCVVAVWSVSWVGNASCAVLLDSSDKAMAFFTSSSSLSEAMFLHGIGEGRNKGKCDLCLTCVAGLWRLVRSTCLIGH